MGVCGEGQESHTINVWEENKCVGTGHAGVWAGGELSEPVQSQPSQPAMGKGSVDMRDIRERVQACCARSSVSHDSTHTHVMHVALIH